MSFLSEARIISILNEEGVTYNVEKGGEVPSDVKPGDTVNVSEEGVEEGKLKNALTGIALFTALIAGNNAITNSNPQMKSLKAAYEQAKDSGDEVKMKELKDKITKQTIYLDTGKGEPQSVKEIVKKCYQKGMTKENISKVIKEYKKRSTKYSIKEEYAPMELPAAKTPNFLGDDGMDYEGGMAKSQMLKMKKYAVALCDMIDDDSQLESWVQAKLTKASDYMSSVYHYLDYQKSQMDESYTQYAAIIRDLYPGKSWEELTSSEQFEVRSTYEDFN